MNRDLVGREGTNNSSRSVKSSHPLIDACVGCMGDQENGCADNYEPGASRSGQWSYVGNGRGGYEQVDQYSYVGEGAGSFSKEVVQVRAPTCSLRMSCVGIFILAIVGMVLASSFVLRLRRDESQAQADSLNQRAIAKSHQSQNAHHVENLAIGKDRARNNSDLAHADHHDGEVEQRESTTLAAKLKLAATSDKTKPTVAASASSPTTSALPLAHVQALFNCKADVFNWEKSWTLGKKLWCCENAEAGCPPPVRPSLENCNATCSWEGSDASCRVRIQWAADNSFTTRKDACSAAHALVVQQCPTCSACTLGATDCKVHAQQELVGMSTTTTTSKPTTTSIPYDCDAEASNWKLSWSNAKMISCCKSVGRGCQPQALVGKEAPRTSMPTTSHQQVPTTTVAPVTPSATTTNHLQTTLMASTIASTIPVTTVSTAAALFDCTAGVLNWQNLWSAGKKMWCCEQTHRGCPETTVATTTLPPSTTTYDCTNPSWSIANQEFCCKQQHVGCKMLTVANSLGLATSSTSVRPSMESGEAHLPHEGLKGLAVARKAQDENGCAMVCAIYGVEETCSARIQFAASHELLNVQNSCAKALVAVLKKCPICGRCPLAEAKCEDSAPAATSSTSVPYDCDAGLTDWKRGWSLLKKDWCCENRFVGCPTQKMASPYDCEPSPNNWKDGWSTSKRNWCCKVQSQGCAKQE